ncbi:hypothetical protein D3C79_1005860 [compost metagenome]
MANLLDATQLAAAQHVACNQAIAQVQVGLAQREGGQGAEWRGVQLHTRLGVCLANLSRVAVTLDHHQVEALRTVDLLAAQRFLAQ